MVVPAKSTRTPPGGTVIPRSTRPPAGRPYFSPSTAAGALRSVPSTASTVYGAPVTHSGARPLLVFTTRSRTCSPGRASSVVVPSTPLIVDELP